MPFQLYIVLSVSVSIINYFSRRSAIRFQLTFQTKVSSIVFSEKLIQHVGKIIYYLDNIIRALGDV